MRKCLEAGCSVSEFFNMSFTETLLLIKAHEGRMNFQMQQTRLLAYTIACTVTSEEERISIYDMFYIPGDPTPEERLKEQQDRIAEIREEQKAFNEELRRANSQNK